MPRAPFKRKCLALTGLLLVMQVAAADAAPADGLTRMQSDICHTFKLDCRKRYAPPPDRHPPATEQTARQQSAKAQPPAAMIPTPIPRPRPPAAAPAPAETTLPVAPIPRERPPALPVGKTVAKTPSSPAATKLLVVPIPRGRPALLPSLQPVASAVVAVPDVPARGGEPEPKTPEVKTASIPPQAATPIGPSDCEQSLRNGKVQFDAVPASFGDATCPIVDPVRLHSVATPSGVVNFPEGPVFNCRFARQFALWVSDTGSAVVLAQTNKRLEKVATGPGYDCRHRNGDSSAKMSEHAAGDAVDITSMTIADGTTIHMADAINPASPSYPMLRALRTTACGYFTTVLGPGANEAHKEHYHFDLGVHGKSNNYRICE